MNDWKAKLEGLNQNLRAKEQAEQTEKAATLAAFRKLLAQLEPVLKSVAEFGDVFGVDCDFAISRFDDRYPYVQFRIRKPALSYQALCRDGEIHEKVKEGEQAARETLVTLQSLAPKTFEKRITDWVRAAAEANRKIPGKR